MTLDSFVLFVHVVSAIGFFIALALEGFVSLRVAWAQDADQMRFFLSALERLKWIAIPSIAGILLGGLYLAYPYAENTFWIPAALLATLAILAIGGFVSGRKRIQLGKQLAQPNADFPALAARARAGSLAVSYGLRVGLAVAIVFLMTAQPDLWPSLLALAAGSVAGLCIASAYRRISRRAAPGCRPLWQCSPDRGAAPSLR